MLKTLQCLLGMIAALCIMATLPVAAQTHQETRANAEAGDMFAQFQMGLDYELGQGVAVDKAQAARWYQKSIDSGLHWAYAHLAQMYEQGEGVPKDAEKAKQYAAIAMEKTLDEMTHPEKYGHIRAYLVSFKDDALKATLKAAKDGDEDAQSSLADSYLHGRDGFEQNDDLALYWYMKIAERGDNFAIQQVGRLLLTGDLGSSPDIAKANAIKWHQDAQAKGHSASKRQIEKLAAMSADDVTAMIRETQLDKALAVLGCDQGNTLPCGDTSQKSALLKIKALADQELTSAESVWGSLLFDERHMAKLGAKPDPAAAIAYLNKAAEKNDENAMLFLARVYEHGRGVPKDTTAALMWYDRVMTQMTAEKAEAAKNNHYISGGNDTLIQCKLYFLRGDKIAEHTRQECTAWDREAFYRAY